MNEAAAAAAAIVSGSDVPDNHYDDSSSSSSDGGYPYDDGREASNAGHQRRLEDLLNDSDEEDYDGNGDDETGIEKRYKYKIPRKDKLYNPNKDEEDEAYVYKHLRHGMEEIQMASIKIRTREGKSGGDNTGNEDKMKIQQQEQEQAISEGKQPSQSGTTGTCSSSTSQQRLTKELSRAQSQSHVRTIQQHAKILKPRSSDAILSCPCCFQIVCMDCQRHERYTNQFRAMFVMNIDVRWDVHVATDSDHKSGNSSTGNVNVVDQQPSFHANVVRPGEGGRGGESDIYYSVVCANCRTEVAALDMKDEVYHFFGCLASS